MSTSVGLFFVKRLIMFYGISTPIGYLMPNIVFNNILNIKDL